MYIHGSFINKVGDVITVHVVTNSDRTEEMLIGDDKSGLYFTDDPVEISNEVNDTFDVLLRQSASVRMLARNFVPDFYCQSARDAVVNIYRNDQCIFAGYIEPRSYSQPYNDLYDEIELNCIDALSALQYSKYRNIGAAGVVYDIVKADAVQRSFYDLLTEILNGVTDGIDIRGGHNIKYLYDTTKGVNKSAGSNHTVFENIGISELLFLGDTEDDTWQQDEVLEEILRYLNLHIVQDGFTFYIFDWATIRATGTTQWADLHNNLNVEQTNAGSYVIDNDLVADCDTNIEVGEVFNQLILSCDIKDIDSAIESPLDDDLLVSAFGGKQKYLTEYVSEGKGEPAYSYFYDIMHDEKVNTGIVSVTDWYIEVKKNTKWRFPWGKVGDLVDYLSADGTNQQEVPNCLAVAPGAVLMALGSTKKNMADTDNAVTKAPDMTNYFVLSVNGNGKNGEDARPSGQDISARIPYAEYEGNKAGGVFSPTDEDTTNYFVISGSFVLNPLRSITKDYGTLHLTTDWEPFWKNNPNYDPINHPLESRGEWIGKYMDDTVIYGDKFAYYTYMIWRAEYFKDEPIWDSGTSSPGLDIYTGNAPESLEYNYSAIGENTDKISKLSVLACMLIVGDQCVIETGTEGKPSDFKWTKYKTREECASDDEYYRQCFYLGFDPKIGDNIIGVEHNIQNNIDYKMGLDVEGTAIPIKMGDKVSGNVTFKILGPVNATWDVITRRHPTFFRHTKWTSTSVPVLAHVSNIFIKEFEVKLYSDNGFFSKQKNDNGVAYMSDTVESFVNKKDDLEFKICTALSSAEASKMGVSSGPKMSTPVNLLTGNGLTSVYDVTQDVEAKPEQIYVDAYYQEYHLPRIVMQQNVNDAGGVVSRFNHFRHPALNKEFYVTGIGRNLMDGTAGLTLKELFQV